MALCTRTTDYFPNIQETVNTIVTDVRQLLEDQMQAELQSSIFGNIKDQMLASEAMIRAKEALVLFMPSKQFSGISSDLSSTIPMGSHLSANEKAAQPHQSNLHYVSRLPSELSLTLSSNDPFATLEVLANHHASVLNKLDEANLELQGLTADRDQWSTTCQEQCMSIISLESALKFLASSASDMLEDLGNAYTSFHGAVFGTGEKGNPFLSAAAVMGQEKSNNEALVHINNTLLKHTESLQKMQKRTSKEIHAKNTIELAAAEELANTRLEQINEYRNKLSSSMQREKTLKKKILDIEKDICSRDKEHEAKVQEILTNANRLERKNDELKSELMLRKGEITRIESILEGKSSKLESMENEFNNLLKDISDKNDTIRDLINSLRGAKESLLLLENKAHSDRENIMNEYEISLKKKEESLIQAHIRALTDKEADIISRDKLIRKQQEENAILKASFDEMKRIDDVRVLELTRMKNATELLSNSSTVEVTMLQKLVKDKMDEIERMQAELHETKTTLKLHEESLIDRKR